ncbi:Uncharacterised protein [Vibrio cholerae]|nr:Uncharacterised protein [Vibrio cholerae]
MLISKIFRERFDLFFKRQCGFNLLRQLMQCMYDLSF